MIGDTSGHRRRDSQRFMDAGKIVAYEVKRNHVPVVLQFLAETVSQTNEALVYSLPISN
jgi:hypothetical protein